MRSRPLAQKLILSLTIIVVIVEGIAGYINVRVRDIPMDHTVEADTPLAAATLWEPGLYRIDVDRDREVVSRPRSRRGHRRTVRRWRGAT